MIEVGVGTGDSGSGAEVTIYAGTTTADPPSSGGFCVSSGISTKAPAVASCAPPTPVLPACLAPCSFHGPLGTSGKILRTGQAVGGKGGDVQLRVGMGNTGVGGDVLCTLARLSMSKTGGAIKMMSGIGADVWAHRAATNSGSVVSRATSCGAQATLNGHSGKIDI